ncbi:MAG: hypothetical protein DRI65_17275 [Chloroflexota bacterium]|nr:MAG: hypothetical protein DRI65_17275 [Chloroflexota bacterium]
MTMNLPTRSEIYEVLAGDFTGYKKEHYDKLTAVDWAYVVGHLVDMKRVQHLLNRLADQQAMPDDWWRDEWASIKGPNETCNCGQCGRMHASDCAVHNEPAYPKGACDCE